jgi:hypothetical protein
VATALGLVGFVVFIIGVISIAGGVSWAVVKLSPKPKAKPDNAEPSS